MAGLARSLSRRALLGLRAPITRPTIVIADHCLAHKQIACESCSDACDSGAIEFRHTGRVRQPVIDSERCTGCKACLDICPANALSIQKPSEVAG